MGVYQGEAPAQDPTGSHRYGLLGTTPAGKAAPLILGGQGEQFTQTPDILALIRAQYKSVLLYQDDFGDGQLHGWREQYDSTGRVGITLSDEARIGNYSLLMHSRPAASDEAWCRKGIRVPDGMKKVIKGCYFMFHGANANNPGSLNFDFDYQPASGTERRYFRLRYLNYSGGIQAKWQANTGNPTSQTFTDVTGGGMTVPWNESEKPMLNYMVGVFDLENYKYERLLSNGLDIDMTAQNIGPTAGASLSGFDKGAVDLYVSINRSDSSEDNLFWVSRPFLAYVP